MMLASLGRDSDILATMRAGHSTVDFPRMDWVVKDKGRRLKYLIPALFKLDIVWDVIKHALALQPLPATQAKASVGMEAPTAPAHAVTTSRTRTRAPTQQGAAHADAGEHWIRARLRYTVGPEVPCTEDIVRDLALTSTFECGRL